MHSFFLLKKTKKINLPKTSDDKAYEVFGLFWAKKNQYCTYIFYVFNTKILYIVVDFVFYTDKNQINVIQYLHFK